MIQCSFAIGLFIYIVFGNTSKYRFQNMIIDEENQCVIISGESGAGVYKYPILNST